MESDFDCTSPNYPLIFYMALQESLDTSLHHNAPEMRIIICFELEYSTVFSIADTLAVSKPIYTTKIFRVISSSKIQWIQIHAGWLQKTCNSQFEF